MKFKDAGGILLDHLADPLHIVTELGLFLPGEDKTGVLDADAWYLADGRFTDPCELAEVVRAGNEPQEPEVAGISGNFKKSGAYCLEISLQAVEHAYPL